ncbi:MAG: RNA polymerase sigma factor [Pseudomonadota bacterium]
MQDSGRDFHRFDGGYLQRLRMGDPDTERHFVSYFKDLLRIKLNARLRSRQLVEDACQETFLRVFKALRSDMEIRNPERIGAYVNTVCDHVLLELYRSEKRHMPVSDASVAEIEDDAPIVEDRLLADERRALVRRAIDELPDIDRRLLRALFVEDRDKDEVCEEFEVDRSYLRVLLHRAKLRFRALYLARSDDAHRNG